MSEPSNPRTIRVIGRTRRGLAFAAHFVPSSQPAEPATHRLPKNRSACAGSYLGELDWPAILQAIGGYDGMIELEFEPVDVSATGETQMLDRLKAFGIF